MPIDSYTPAGQQLARRVSWSGMAGDLPDRTVQAPVQRSVPAPVLRGGRAPVQRSVQAPAQSMPVHHWSNNDSNITIHHHYPDEEESMTSLRSKYIDRGTTIQRHEGRFHDCNELLSQLKQRLDPDGRITGSMNDSDVRRIINNHARRAFSSNEQMQSYYNFLVAYDHMYGVRNDEKRLKQMAATVRIQGSLIQEQTETIERLNKALGTAQAKLPGQLVVSQPKLPNKPVAPQKKQAPKPAAQQKKQAAPKPVAQQKKQAPKPAPVKKGDSLVQLSPSAFKLENHHSLTFTGFSEQNRVNPARLQIMNSDWPRSTSYPSKYSDDMAQYYGYQRITGANVAPLGAERKRHRGMDTQGNSASPAMSASGGNSLPSDFPRYSQSPFAAYEGRDHDMRDASEFASDPGSKRPISFLNYGDEPGRRPESVNKRLKSGALTPPLPEELGVHAFEKAAEVGADFSGGVPIKSEGGVDLEMGEILEERPQTVADAKESKYIFEGLDDMISEAKANATT